MLGIILCNAGFGQYNGDDCVIGLTSNVSYILTEYIYFLIRVVYLPKVSKYHTAGQIYP